MAGGAAGGASGGGAGGLAGGSAGGFAGGTSGGGSSGGGAAGGTPGPTGYLVPDGGYPSVDRWLPVTQTNGPGQRVEHVSVWSGTEVLVWGGTTASGHAWNPSTNTWRAMSTTNQPLGFRRSDGVWTGTELIIWGGAQQPFAVPSTYVATGARYNPTTDSWQPMSTIGAPSARWLHRLGWTGTEVVVFGGVGPVPDAGEPLLGDGALYDPATDQWRALPSTNAPAADARPEVIAIGGNEVLVFSACVSSGARLNLSTLQWSPMSMTGLPQACGFTWTALATAWTGRDVLVVGAGSGLSNPLVGGHRYDPAADRWSPLPKGDPCDRIGPTAVWTGSEFITWGGGAYGSCPVPYVDWQGYRYRPATNTWQPMSLVSQPNFQERTNSVWTGREVVFTGGRGAGSGVGVVFSAAYRP